MNLTNDDQSTNRGAHETCPLCLACGKDYDGSVSYCLPEPYPAEATLKQIRSQLEGKTWKPVPEDLVNPGMTNSQDRGWMNYIDGTRSKANVFLWSAALGKRSR